MRFLPTYTFAHFKGVAKSKTHPDFDKYNERIINLRFNTLIHQSMQPARFAYFYAKYFIGDRWLEAEPIIIKDSQFALSYAVNILKRPWPEAESAISKNQLMMSQYKRIFNIK